MINGLLKKKVVYTESLPPSLSINRITGKRMPGGEKLLQFYQNDI